jgi:hypothetical protein
MVTPVMFTQQSLPKLTWSFKGKASFSGLVDCQGRAMNAQFPWKLHGIQEDYCHRRGHIYEWCGRGLKLLLLSTVSLLGPQINKLTKGRKTDDCYTHFP